MQAPERFAKASFGHASVQNVGRRASLSASLLLVDSTHSGRFRLAYNPRPLSRVWKGSVWDSLRKRYVMLDVVAVPVFVPTHACGVDALCARVTCTCWKRSLPALFPTSPVRFSQQHGTCRSVRAAPTAGRHNSPVRWTQGTDVCMCACVCHNTRLTRKRVPPSGSSPK